MLNQIVLDISRKYLKFLLLENFIPRKHKNRYSSGRDEPFSVDESPDKILLLSFIFYFKIFIIEFKC